jgi:hypothetical protein
MRSLVFCQSRTLSSLLVFGYLKVCLVVLASAGLIAYLSREPLLQMAGDIWIVSDPVTHADAIVILGGHPTVRPLVAAELYRKGFAKKILISKVFEGNPVGPSPGDTEKNRRALLGLGLPDSAIGTFGTANKSTMDEAVALKDWAEQNGASVFIVPAEIFFARRVSWAFHRKFSGSAVRIEVLAFEPRGYEREAWWKTEGGRGEFQREILRYVFYRLMY